MTDSTQMWTAQDKKRRGRKLCLTSGKGKDECLTIEDNTETVITMAGYWSDFHAGWAGSPKGLIQVGCFSGDTYAITEPATHLNEPVSLPQGIGGRGNGHAPLNHIAAMIVSTAPGSASATASHRPPADNFK